VCLCLLVRRLSDSNLPAFSDAGRSFAGQMIMMMESGGVAAAAIVVPAPASAVG